MLQQTAKQAGIAGTLTSRTAAYQAALSHSKLVRKLKVLLPVTAGIISAAFIGVAILKTYLPENLSIESARIENGKIVMEKPAISGRNQDGISYSMIATRALQDIQNPNMISLEDVKAAVPINDDVIARVTASGADFDRGADKLDLTKPFDVNLSNGITAKFKSAHLDIPGGLMNTADPVNISMNAGSIIANSMKITDKGHTITFIGQVRANFDPVRLRNQGK
jgi:lipopolysaccharide export system protein LptC